MSPTAWPFRNVGLKALSAGLALLLWLVIAGEENVERTLTVPLELSQFPQTLELVGEPPTHVDVRLRGPSGSISRMSATDVVAALDLGGASPGRRLYQLTPDQVRVPFGVQAIQVTPATIAMVFDRSVTREVEVNPTIQGVPAPGHIVGSVRTDPPIVEVVGPESLFGQTVEAITETVSISGATTNVNQVVTIGFLEAALRLKVPRRASVSVEILPAPRERTLSGLPVHLRGLRSDLSAQAVPSIVDVRLRGSQAGLDRIVPDLVNAFVDLTGLGVGEYMLTVHVDPLSDAGVDQVDPSAVDVSINRVSR